MKIKENGPKEDFGPVKLFYDDLEFIQNQINQLPKDQYYPDKNPVSLKADEYELSGDEKLLDVPKKKIETIEFTYSASLKEIGIVLFNVKIHKNNSYAFCTVDSPLFNGVFNKIAERMKSLRRKMRWTNGLSIIASSFGFAISLLIIMGKVYQTSILTNVAYILITIMMLLFILDLVSKPFRHSEILLLKKEEQKSFWVRNKDVLIISVITGIISLLAGIFGTLIIQFITK